MGVFNIIETFFFLSLAITFVLILLLVNHFKQRINQLEQKNATMFEIINSMMQQIDMIMYRVKVSPNVPFQPMSKCEPEIVTEIIDDIAVVYNTDSKIVVSDDEEDTDDDNDDSDDEEEDEDDDKIKIISMDIPDNINVEYLDDEDECQESSSDLEEPLCEIAVFDDSFIMQIEKVEPELEPEPEPEPEESKEGSKDIYNKMTVQDLKKAVITKGLGSDVSKLKKTDLLKLLENE